MPKVNVLTNIAGTNYRSEGGQRDSRVCRQRQHNDAENVLQQIFWTLTGDIVERRG